jgi:hypothetical protein
VSREINSQKGDGDCTNFISGMEIYGHKFMSNSVAFDDADLIASTVVDVNMLNS